MESLNEKFKMVTLLFVSSFFIMGCGNDDNGDVSKDPEEGRTEWFDEDYIEKTVDVLAEVLEKKGIDLPKNTKVEDNQSKRIAFALTDSYEGVLNDYIEWENANINQDALYEDHWHNTAEERIKHEKELGLDDIPLLQLKMWLDEDGNVIPGAERRENHSDYCSDQDKYNRSPAKLLVFTIFDDPEIKEVYLKQIDIETRKVEHPSWGKPDINDPDWKEKGISEAWDKLNKKTGIKNFVGFCEEKKIEHTLYFDSKMSVFESDYTTFDHVVGTIVLNFDNKNHVYNGEGDFEWVESTVEIPGGSTSHSKKGMVRNFKVDSLILPNLAKTSSELGLNLRFDYEELNTFNGLWIIFYENDLDKKTNSWTLRNNWKVSGSGEKLMTLSIHREMKNPEKDSQTFKENTTIEIE